MDMPGYYHPIISNHEFINSKLTAKVMINIAKYTLTILVIIKKPKINRYI